MDETFSRRNLIEIIDAMFDDKDWQYDGQATDKGIPNWLEYLLNLENRIVLPLDDWLRSVDSSIRDLSESDREFVANYRKSILAFLSDVSENVHPSLRNIIMDIEAATSNPDLLSKNNADKLRSNLVRKLGAIIRDANRRNFPNNMSLANTGEFEGPPDVSEVFLSHQFVDRLYVIGLYYLFKKHGISLYADWMYNRQNKDIANLKKELSAEICKRGTFATLPHVISSFGINDTRTKATLWCAWEAGISFDQSERKPHILICPTGQGKYGEIYRNFFKAYSITDFKQAMNVGKI